jgi:hypothetical protein
VNRTAHSNFNVKAASAYNMDTLLCLWHTPRACQQKII